MKNRNFLVVASALACLSTCGGSAVAPPVPASPPKATAAEPSYSARQFFETVTVRGASFNHDETKILVSSDDTGVYNVYSLPVSGGDRVTLTNSTTNATYGVSYFPKDDRFLYTSDAGGNEQSHLFVMSKKGVAKDLTPGEKSKSSFFGWSGDKKSFLVLSNERDAKQFDLYRYSSKDYTRTMVFKNTEAWIVEDLSPDGRYLALIKVENNVESNVYLWDTKRPKRKPALLTKHEGDGSHSVKSFTPDSKALIYSTDIHDEFVQLWSYQLKAQTHQVHTKADWDVVFATFSEQGKYVVTGINADARTQIEMKEVASGLPVILPELPIGQPSTIRFSQSETKMAFYMNEDRSSSNLFVVDLETQKLIQLTDTMNKAINSDKLVEAEVIRFASFDGLEIPSILYKPNSATKGANIPVVLFMHGGPGGQSRLGYNPMIQHLVNHGIGVLAVNNRGSSGYGKSFNHADDRKHGDVDLKDCIWAKKYLQGLDWVDGSRIGIMGGSYGGYLVLAALAFAPEEFKVGVDIFGVSNWIRTLTSIPPWWASFAKYLYAEIGHPEEDRERLEAHSPLLHADKIIRPLLVVQGANDPRVLKAESDEIVSALKANKIPVEYVLFPDEGHGFRKRENKIKASEAYLAFLKKYL